MAARIAPAPAGADQAQGLRPGMKSVLDEKWDQHRQGTSERYFRDRGGGGSGPHPRPTSYESKSQARLVQDRETTRRRFSRLTPG